MEENGGKVWLSPLTSHLAHRTWQVPTEVRTFGAIAAAFLEMGIHVSSYTSYRDGGQIVLARHPRDVLVANDPPEHEAVAHEAPPPPAAMEEQAPVLLEPLAGDPPGGPVGLWALIMQKSTGGTGDREEVERDRKRWGAGLVAAGASLPSSEASAGASLPASEASAAASKSVAAAEGEGANTDGVGERWGGEGVGGRFSLGILGSGLSFQTLLCLQLVITPPETSKPALYMGWDRGCTLWSKVQGARPCTMTTTSARPCTMMTTSNARRVCAAPTPQLVSCPRRDPRVGRMLELPTDT